MAPKFMKELLDAMADNYSKWAAAQSIRNLPETADPQAGEENDRA